MKSPNTKKGARYTPGLLGVLGDNDGMTGLMLAAKYGRVKVVDLLLAKGAEKNLSSKNGSTALAKASHKGHAETVRLLLDVAAARDLRNSDGLSAMMAASQQGHIDTRLFSHVRDLSCLLLC